MITEARASDPATSGGVLESKSTSGQAGIYQANATINNTDVLLTEETECCAPEPGHWELSSPLGSYQVLMLTQCCDLMQEHFSKASLCLLLWGPVYRLY